MKTSGVKVEIFPILGEVTCLSSSLPGDFFPSSAFFFPFFWPFASPSSSPGSRSPPHHHQVSCSSAAPSVSLLRSAAAATAARQKQLQRQATEAAVGGSTELHFSGHFQATSGDDLVA